MRTRDTGGLTLLNLTVRPAHKKRIRKVQVSCMSDVAFKPMLAVDCGPVEELTFPLIASPKLDGVRAIVGNGVLLARSLKPIPNARIQTIFYGLPVGLDGELLAGVPTAPDVYRRTVSMVMSQDLPIDGVNLWLFDYQMEGPFTARYAKLKSTVEDLQRHGAQVQLVPQIIVEDLEHLLRLEAEWLAAGYEGAILRMAEAAYKHGRSTRKERYLLKLKRFKDSEARVIGVQELMHNDNGAVTNELGRTERSSCKDGLTPAGTMGALEVVDIKTGVRFDIGTGFDAGTRQRYWEGGIIGKVVKYKYFPTGSKDKPRHPVFLGERDLTDM